MAPAWLTQPKLPEAVKRKNLFSLIKPDGTTDLLPDEYDEALALVRHGFDGHSYDDFIEAQNRKLKLRDQYFRALWGENYRERLGAGDDRDEAGNKEKETKSGNPFFSTLRIINNNNIEDNLSYGVRKLVNSKRSDGRNAGALASGERSRDSASMVPGSDGQMHKAVDMSRGFDENGNMAAEWMLESNDGGCYFGGVFVDCEYNTGDKAIHIHIDQTPEAREALLDKDYRKALVEAIVNQYNQNAAEDGRKPLNIENGSLSIEIREHIKGYVIASNVLQNPNTPAELKYLAEFVKDKCNTIDIGGLEVEKDRAFWDGMNAVENRYVDETDIDPFPFNVD